jgi:isoleucyl-tRNA synthetase
MEKDNKKIDYRSTVNLPKTAFPMRGNLPQREPETLKFWESIDLYNKIQQKNAKKEWFLLHDGPPYANGHIHMGTSLNKTLKDFVVKYKNMQGFRSPYVPGWDCHGLPVEHQLLKEMKKTKHDVELLDFRRKAARYALKWVNVQREEFKRLGIFAQWDKPYLTLNHEYEAKEVECFGKMFFDGYVYKGLKPIHWCYRCETALAEAEVEYQDKTSSSIYVKFKASDELSEKFGVQKASVLIWTTTPWTLPANMAVAVKSDFVYSAVKVGEEVYIIAKESLPRLTEELGWENPEIIGEIAGAQLEHLTARHPFIDRDSVVILADYVTLDQGTGCVHTAPGHGQDDYFSGLKYGLEVLSPVNEQGKFMAAVSDYEGKHVFQANQHIVDDLKKQNKLAGVSDIEHSYPHCWRCKAPVIFRATRQWFINVDHNELRSKTLKEIENVRWIPGFGENRIKSMVEQRPDWCISRQRLWGVPITLFTCAKCDTELLTPEILEKLVAKVHESGVDVWFEEETSELLPEGTTCPECGGTDFKKDFDILDVWFDSGMSHQSVLETRDNLKFPAELYLEGSDQHRGWFQSALLTAMSVAGRAPYKTVLTHGYTLDAKGVKESKSKGNVTSPLDITKQYGAEILRLWVSSVDYSSDVIISKEAFLQMADAYRKIRNTLRFLMGNLDDFDPATDAKSYDELTGIEQWALASVQKLVRDVTAAYDNFEFHKVHHLVYNFCTIQLSSFYLDILKDRLYTAAADSLERRSSQTVFHYLVKTLIRLLAPVLSFTAEEVWRICRKDDEPESVHLLDFPQINSEWDNAGLIEKWDRLIKIRGEAAKVIEGMRASKEIGNSLGCKIELFAESGELFEFLDGFKIDLAKIFIVSGLTLKKAEQGADEAGEGVVSAEGVTIKVSKADGEKCRRCWRHQKSVGLNSDHPEICEDCLKVVLSQT